MADDGPDTYLFVVGGDADPERVAATLDDHEDGEVRPIDGVARLATGLDHEALHEELSEGFPGARVDAYRLEPVDPGPSEATVTVERHLDAQHEVVRRWVNSMVSQKKAVRRPGGDGYDVYTKKGTAHVTTSLSEPGDGEGTHVRIRVSGYQPAPEYLADFFETELAEYADR